MKKIGDEQMRAPWRSLATLRAEREELIRLCQSGCGPCDKLCDTCRDAPAKYAERVRQEAIANAIRVLEGNGYKIEKPSPERVTER